MRAAGQLCLAHPGLSLTEGLVDCGRGERGAVGSGEQRAQPRGDGGLGADQIGECVGVLFGAPVSGLSQGAK